MPVKRILLVGHCGFDAANLRRAVAGAAGEGVDVDEAERDEDARSAGPDTLLLVNRELGWGFGVSTGVELIRELAAGDNPPATMLISNYEDAQRAAIDAGARPGFGKAQLNTPTMRDRLHAALK